MGLKLSVIIPMYNEEKHAADTARTLSAFLDGKFPDGDYEIIFSNDGSRDSCAEKDTELNLPQVRVIGYPDNRGKGSAVREGVMNSLPSSIPTVTLHTAVTRYTAFTVSL